MTNEIKEAQNDIFKSMHLADAVVIDDDYVRNFDKYEFDEGVDIDRDNGLALAICSSTVDAQFTFADLDKAKKVGLSWFVTEGDSGDEYQLTFEKVISF